MPEGKHVHLTDGDLASAYRGVIFLTQDADMLEGSCRFVQTAWTPSTAPRVVSYLTEYRRRRSEWAALASTADSNHAMTSFLEIGEKLLGVSDGGIKALKEVSSGFTGLPLFPLVPFRHDTLHAGIQCSKRCYARFLEGCWVLGPNFKKACAEKLDRKDVPVGPERNQDGSPKEGDNPDKMNQFRGLQEIRATAARAWTVFAEVGVTSSML